MWGVRVLSSGPEARRTSKYVEQIFLLSISYLTQRSIGCQQLRLAVSKRWNLASATNKSAQIIFVKEIKVNIEELRLLILIQFKLPHPYLNIRFPGVKRISI